MSTCVFSLAKAIKSNRDNCADGLIDEACLTGNQCPISAIAPLSDARAPGTFGGGRELGWEARPLLRNPLSSCARRLDPSEHETGRPFRVRASTGTCSPTGGVCARSLSRVDKGRPSETLTTWMRHVVRLSNF